MRRKITAALRKRYADGRVGILENRRAASVTERARLQKRLGELKADEERLNEKRMRLHKSRPADRLLEVAQFVVDVGGQEPSLSQLRGAVEQTAELNDTIEMWRDVREELGRLRPRLFFRRYDAYHDNGLYRHIEASADTLKELASALNV